jgi:hypothetical protein
VAARGRIGDDTALRCDGNAACFVARLRQKAFCASSARRFDS